VSCSPNIDTLAALPKSDSDAIVRIFKQGIFVASPPEYFDKLIQTIDLARAGRNAASSSSAPATNTTVPSASVPQSHTQI
jgi:hypothetical protein